MVAGRAHLREDVVEPLQRAVQVDLDPARRRGHVLAVVVGAPALHERHPVLRKKEMKVGHKCWVEERGVRSPKCIFETNEKAVSVKRMCKFYKYICTSQNCNDCNGS